VHLTWQYQVRPTRAQHVVLERILEGQRLLYNSALEERREAWRRAGKSITRKDQFQSLTQIRAGDATGYGALPANLSRWTLARVDQAFKGFFGRVKTRKGKAGYPRFRGRGHWRSFGFLEFSGIRLLGERLQFKGLTGGLKVWLHRPLPDKARICSCVFTRQGRRWVLNLQLEIADTIHVHPQADRYVGLDWGIENLVTLSDGTILQNPRFGQEAALGIRRVARMLARRRKGARRREKARQHLQSLQRRLKNRRRTYLHQQSTALTRRFARIAVEDLNVNAMTASARGTMELPGRNVRQKAGLNREILDTAPSMFAAMLRYKAERAGGTLTMVDPRRTSIACSQCGHDVPKALNERMHRCPNCNLEIHRDVNAARVILRRAVVGPWSGSEDVATPGTGVAPELSRRRVYFQNDPLP
jgi:putative transposase